MRLDAIAKVIRSKNAGPCLLTLDVMLPDAATFAYVTARLRSASPASRTALRSE